MEPIPPLPPANPLSTSQRSVFVTVLAWIIIVISGLLVPISVISLLMILAGSPGTSTFDPIGFLLVIVAPAASVAGGIGLLRRKAWARYYVIGLLSLLIVANAWDLLTASSETTTYTSPSGVQTTVMTSYAYTCYQIPIMAMSAVLLIGLLRRSVRDEFKIARTAQAPAIPRPSAEQSTPLATGRDWRVGHQGRDRMYYEEWQNGTWERIDIEGEMLTGLAHHVIYFASPEQWQQYPEWARHRRDEIIARVKSEFRPPDYEYHGEPAEQAATPAGAPAIAQPKSPAVSPLKVTPQQRATLLLVIVIFAAITAGMAWFVTSGLNSGTTYLPSKRASQQRTVTRQTEPATYWLSIGIYSTIGLAAGGATAWFIREARQNS